MPVAKKIRWPTASDSIFIPPTFPIASMNRYTRKYSGVLEKLTWFQQFGLQIFPKEGDADFFAAEKRLFLGIFLLKKECYHKLLSA